ncbi:MAG: DUF4062 domain-containing protein [Candidatus Hydrogenedentes bacterium]|nr:DUF4062 domain-containing protein [Candidatus Hydrogenedentota bacterium]
MANWQTRPVFVSSTFRDMHVERDYLRDHVFPELAERLQARRHRLEPIDLRWGVETVSVDEEHSKELLVLKVCLTEIERSRPFLIALMGDRYGWVPPKDRMQTAVDEQGYSTAVPGKSVTALEIEFGVLDSMDQRRRSFFYFREPLPYDEMDATTAAIYSDAHSDQPDGKQAADRLSELKRRIERELPDRVRRYSVRWDAAQNEVTGVEALGRMVLDDLWRELDSETDSFAQQPDPSWQQQERWALEEFIEHRSRNFVGREPTLDTLRTLALSPAAEGADWGASVTGESGSGKSALIAQLHRVLEAEDVLLLTHAAGISLRANQVDAMLLRWIEELAEFLGVPIRIEDNAKPDDIDDTFRALLSQASQRKRVVVLVDALNQFEPTTRARYLTWLPKLWPANATLIATAIPDTASETLHQRPGIARILVPPLSIVEAEAIAHTICRRYHREINSEVLAALTDKQLPDGKLAASNPLWLTLAIEELNLLDADDFVRADREFTGTPEARLHQLLVDVATRLPANVAGLYGWMLGRAEELHGEAWARAFANLIAVSRAGWRESDFLALMPSITGEAWDPLRFAGLRRSFRAQLVQRGAQGQWDFFHVQMREAVLAHNLPAEARNGLHTRIADHLETLQNTDSLRESELMVHLISADDKLRAARYYGGDLLSGERAGASRAIADHILADAGKDPNPGLEWAVALIRGELVQDSALATLCHRYLLDVSDHLENRTVLTVFATLFEASRETFAALLSQYPTNAEWQRGLAISQERIGDVLSAQGDASGALVAYRASLAIFERLALQYPTDAESQHELAISQERTGDVLRAQGDASGALAAYRASLAIFERIAPLDLTNAEWQRDLAVSQERIGNVLRAQGDASGALAAYRASLAIAECLALQDPTNAEWQQALAVSQSKVGDVLLAQGDASGALAAHRASLTGRERLVLQDPTNAVWQRDLTVSQERIGDVLLAQGNTSGAVAAYRASLASRERLVRQDPTNAVWQHDLAVSHIKVGDVLLTQGDASGALAKYRASLTIHEHLVHQDPTNAEWQRDLAVTHVKEGDVLLTQGDAYGALAAYRESLASHERLLLKDTTNAVWQRGLAVTQERIGNVLFEQGDASGALAAYRASNAICERLALQDTTNAEWQRDLAVGQERIGDAMLAQRDASGALAAYGASLAIHEQLMHQDPTNAEWQRNLAVSHVKVGDVLRAQGNTSGALAAYRASLAIRERLVIQDPTNAVWQRGQMISYLRLADISVKRGEPCAREWWQKAYDTLYAMKQHGIMLPSDEQYLVALRKKLQ